MQASLPAAPQTPAAAQAQLPVQPQSAGAVRTPATSSLQFDAVILMAMAMAGAAQTDRSPAPTAQPSAPQPASTAPADQSPADQSSASAGQSAAPQQNVPATTPAAAAAATPQMLPLLEAAVVTAQAPPAAGKTATAATRKGTASDRQRPAHAEPHVPAAPAVMPSIQGLPLAAPPTGPGTPPEPAATFRLRMATIEDASAVARQPADAIAPHLAVPSPAEPQSTVPDDPSPAAHDAHGAAPIAPLPQPSSQLTPDPSQALLLTSTQSPPTTPSTSAATAPPPRSTIASPAEQVAPALVSMAHAPDGTQRLTLRLDPPELGHVQIRVERPPEAPAHVDITVEKAETLTLLLRDQPQLQRALDQAGVPPDGRTVTFHIASTEPGPRHEGGLAPSAGTASAGTGDASYGASRQGGGQTRWGFADAVDTDADIAQAALPDWVRAGLDITA